MTCPDDFSDDLKDLLHKLLDKDPSKRPTAIEMMGHKWFNPVFDKTQEFEGDDREENVDDNFLLNDEEAK